MTRDQAIDLARSLAVAQGAGYSAPAYLPRNVVQAEGFMPHEWVIGAITAAFDAGQAKQAAVTKQPDAPMPAALWCTDVLAGWWTSATDDRTQPL